MRENDGRKLSHEAMEQIRITAVKRVESGGSPEAVIKGLGFKRVCMYIQVALSIPCERHRRITGKKIIWPADIIIRGTASETVQNNY